MCRAALFGSLGGARAVNRRYISDHVPSKQRTAASAAFVSAGALGMAAGPFIAGLLSELNFKVSAAPCAAEKYIAAPYHTVQYSTAQYSAVQYLHV